MYDEEDEELVQAILMGDRDSVADAIDAGADIDRADANGDTPLHIASSWGYAEIVRVLCESGAALNAENIYFMTPLHLAAIGGHTESVRVLLAAAEKRHDPLSHDTLEEILRVCKETGAGNPEIFALIRKFEASWSSPTVEGADETDAMLIAACNAGDAGAAASALDEGASPDASDEDDTSALRWASRKGHEGIVRLLVERGASVNKRSKTGWSALMEAATEGNARIVAYLLDNGADPGAKTYVNGTSLIFAARSGHIGIVRMLLERGADPSIRISRSASDAGKDARKVASENGYDEIAMMIDEYASRNGDP